MKHSLSMLAAVAVFANTSSAAQAETIRLTGTLEIGCTLTSEPGLLAANWNYTQLGSEETGGKTALLGVIPVGGAVQVIFTQPVLTSTAPTNGIIPEMKYRTKSGTYSRGYSETAPQQFLHSSDEIYEIDVRASDPNKFGAGDYEISTIATCST